MQKYSTSALALAFALVLTLAVAGVAVAQPANDDCSAAIDIGPGAVSGSTLDATNDGDASCGFAGSGTPDVWYSYTATENVNLSASTCDAGTDYDTAVSFHSGCPGDLTNEIACDDDDFECEFDTLFSNVSSPVAAGETVLIRVHGFNGAVGNFTLNLSEAPLGESPANDNCEDAHPVGPGTYLGATSAATNDGSASCALSDNSPDTWYSYTPAEDGTVSVSTCAAATDYDTAISVHTSCPGDDLNELACNDDDATCVFSTLESSVFDLPVTGGETYLIRVHGFNGANGNYGFTVSGTEAGGLALSQIGSCPGQQEIRLTGATPNSNVVFVIDEGTGDFAVPGGPCVGTETDVSGNLVVSPIKRPTDGLGRARIKGNAPSAACGAAVQAVDVSTCGVSSLTSID